MITETVNERISSRIRYVKPVLQSLVSGITSEVYQQMKDDFMPAPLLMLHSAATEILQGVWSIVRETLLSGSTDRAVKEVVAAAISKINDCNYCLEAHTLLLRSTSGHRLADAILSGDYDHIDDPKLHSMFKWPLTTSVDEFRRYHSADSELIAATSWASFTAARRVGVWINK